MNIRQRIILAVSLSLTAGILTLDNLFPGEKAVNYVKFTTVFFLFAVALFSFKQYREKVLLNIAVFFAMVGDFFLDILNVNMPSMYGRAAIYGAMAFFLAYLTLIAAFIKGRGAGRWGLLALAPVLAPAVPVFLMIRPHIWPQLYWGAVIFAFVLCFMAWAALCTMFRGYYSPGAARRLALAGYLILVSDSGVALAQFHPAFAGHFTPWLENIIWGTYIPAWTLVVVSIAGDDLLA
ncbi:MAG: lysoplasmalogenase family protein [Bacillota bacterium]